MPTRNALMFAAAAWAATAVAAVWVADRAVTAFETRAEQRLTAALSSSDSWLSVTADGTMLTLSGAAPDAEARRAALGRLGALHRGMTLRDKTGVGQEKPARAAAEPLARPVLEILLGEDGATLMGRQPQPEIAGRLPAFGDVPLIDMREAVTGAAPRGWPAARDLALAAARELEAGHVSARPGAVSVSASAHRAEDAGTLRARLRAERPEGVALRISVSAPRPVIAPFALAVTLPDEGAAVVETCAAPDDAARKRLEARLAELGAAGDPGCAVGLGAPGPAWTDAALAGLDALKRIGAGRMVLSDADMQLSPIAGTGAETLQAAAGALAEALPQGYSLAPVTLPETEETEPATTEGHKFTAVRTADGAVRLRGVLGDARQRETARSFARAQFGFDTVIDETRLAAALPAGWATRALGGLAALGELRSGQLAMTAEGMELTGVYVGADGRERLDAALTAHGVDLARVSLDVWQEEAIAVDERPGLDQAECAERIALLTEAQPIVFPPGEETIAEESRETVDRIASQLTRCPGARFEIQGHTDSQGRESLNMALSQARATAVLEALLERGVDMVFLHAKGYGETRPIASNETEEGRARNRRITFQPVTETSPQDASAPEAMMAEAETSPAPGAPAPPEAARARANPTDAVEVRIEATEDTATEARVTKGDAGQAGAGGADAEQADAADAGAGQETAAADGDGPPRPRPRPANLPSPGGG